MTATATPRRSGPRSARCRRCRRHSRRRPSPQGSGARCRCSRPSGRRARDEPHGGRVLPETRLPHGSGRTVCTTGIRGGGTGRPWRTCRPMDERLRFAARLLEGEKRAPLCRESGISRVTGCKILERHKACGIEGLGARSGRPRRQANQPVAGRASDPGDRAHAPNGLWCAGNLVADGPRLFILGGAWSFGRRLALATASRGFLCRRSPARPRLPAPGARRQLEPEQQRDRRLRRVAPPEPRFRFARDREPAIDPSLSLRPRGGMRGVLHALRVLARQRAADGRGRCGGPLPRAPLPV